MTNIHINLKKQNMLIIKANSVIQFIINKNCKSTQVLNMDKKKVQTYKTGIFSNEKYAIL